MKCFPAIRQNEKLCEQLAAEIAEDRFPHAYILAGSKGSGKHTLALNIAAALACKSKAVLPCGECDSCKKILGGFSPDVLLIQKEADKKEFSVNLIRQIKDSLYIAPNELEKRVYILEDADLMNTSAQNAFLKMLEEPPAYVVFLLLCTNTQNLLETIKSRAPILNTELVSQEEIRAYLLENSARARELAQSSPDTLRSVVLAANGSIGQAMYICEDAEAYNETRKRTENCLRALTASSMTDLNLLCDSLPTSADAFMQFLEVLKNALRDIAVFKKDRTCTLLYFDSALTVEPYAERLTVAKLIKLVAAIDALSEKLKFNIDLRLAAVTFCGDSRKIVTE